MDLQGIRALDKNKVKNLRSVLNKLADEFVANIPKINTDNYQTNVIKKYFSKYTNKNYPIKLSVPLSEVLAATYKGVTKPNAEKLQILKLVENILQSDSESKYTENIGSLANSISFNPNQLTSQMPAYETFAKSLTNALGDTDKKITNILAKTESKTVLETPPEKPEVKEVLETPPEKPESKKVTETPPEKTYSIGLKTSLLKNTTAERVEQLLREGDISGIYNRYIQLFKDFGEDVGTDIEDIFKNTNLKTEKVQNAYQNLLLVEQLLKKPKSFGTTLMALALLNGIDEGEETEEVVRNIVKQRDTLQKIYKTATSGEEKEDVGEEKEDVGEEKEDVGEEEEKEDFSTPRTSETPAEPTSTESKKVSGRKLRGKKIKEKEEVVRKLQLDTPKTPPQKRLTRKERKQALEAAIEMPEGGPEIDRERDREREQRTESMERRQMAGAEADSIIAEIDKLEEDFQIEKDLEGIEKIAKEAQSAPTPPNTPIKMRVSKPTVKEIEKDRVPTAVDLIPKERLSSEDKSVEQLKDDLDYFYINFPEKLRRIKRISSNKLEPLKRFHKRVVAVLRGDTVEREKQQKMGIVIRGADYIKSALKEIILENSINGLSAENLLVNIEGEPENLKDTAGSYEFKRSTVSGKDMADKMPVSRFIPTTDIEQVEESSARYKRPIARLPKQRAVYFRPETVAKKMVADNPFLSARQPKIRLKYSY